MPSVLEFTHSVATVLASRALWPRDFLRADAKTFSFCSSSRLRPSAAYGTGASSGAIALFS